MEPKSGDWLLAEHMLLVTECLHAHQEGRGRKQVVAIVASILGRSPASVAWQVSRLGYWKFPSWQVQKLQLRKAQLEKTKCSTNN
jgi:hypothetical protein